MAPSSSQVCYILAVISILASEISSLSNKCKQKQIGESLICICNKSYCDDFEFDWPTNVRQLIQFESSKSGKRFDAIDHYALKHSQTTKQESMRVWIDLSKERQTILGFGGAITDASVINANELTPTLKQTFIKSYYGREGLEYTFGRVPISGTDFSNRTYSYDDTQDPDYNLKHWSLAPEDIELKIPFLHEAFRVAESDGRNVKLFCSSWSPPKWMKDNNSFVRGHLKNDTRVYKVYAEYLMKFLDAYKAKNITFWGATVQNEPLSANKPEYFFSSLQFSKEEQEEFISKYLGPALEARGYTKDNFNLMVGDDNTDLIKDLVVGLLSNPSVQKYVAGLAYHWYGRENVPYSALTDIVDSVKEKIKFVLSTEACNGYKPYDRAVELGSWTRAEKYATDIIEGLNRQSVGWVDWNLALDIEGGPNWSENFVDAPIIVNKTSQEFYKQPMYYALGHFSKFIKPGDLIVESIVAGYYTTEIKAVAAHRKDTKHVIITILNKLDTEQKINLLILGKTTLPLTYAVTAGANSVNSFVVHY